jgi:hypothetical protein
MAKQASVTLRGRFPEGTRVGLYARHGYTLSPGAERLSTRTVGKDLTVTFADREPGERLWIAAEIDGTFRHVAVTAKEQPRQKRRLTGAESREKLAQTIFQPTDRTYRVEGPRSAADAPVTGSRARGSRGQPFVAKNAGEPLPKGEIPVEAHPARRIEDARGEQLRSDTITGTAYPVDPSEVQPSLRQDQVPKGTQQRSDTPLGEATIIPAGEAVPAPRQEDVNGPRQRTDTPTGTAYPLPDDAQQPSKRRPKSRSKAAPKRAVKSAKGSTSAERTETKKGDRAVAPKKTTRRKAAASRSRARRGGAPRKK